MIRRAFYGLLLVSGLLLPVASFAMDVSDPGDPALSVSAVPGPDSALCRSLIKHTPDANVDYQPGVDMHGRAVAPADAAGPAQMQLPKTFQIPLTLSLVKALNLNTSQAPASLLGEGTEIPLGTFTISGDHVLFNGQPISDEQQSNLSVLCMKGK